ncbi:MAG TPA: glycosyltransferase family 2 protein [Roseiflexaceae bacterium]|nr:glycosyltransferase family 2 protein [Roseiflexaceae bacterium]
MSKRIGIFIVAYNAETTLAKVLERIPEDVVSKVEEIFVFDDCSQDNTYEVGRSYTDGEAAAKLTIHRNPVNLMYGGNQKRGYAYAIERGLDIVVLLHGDGQYAPEVMQRLLDPLERGEADLVMGSRMLEPGAAIRGRMPLYKYVGNRILTTVQNRLLGTRFSEFHSGYRAYSVAALRSIDLERLTHSWHFDTQIILELLRGGHNVVEVPIPTYYGDEICHVNGLAYAYECVRATALFAWRQRVRRRFTLRTSQRPTE